MCNIYSTRYTQQSHFSLYLFFRYCPRKFVSVQLMTVNKLDFEPIGGSFALRTLKIALSRAVNYSNGTKRGHAFFSPGEILKGYFSVLAYDVCDFFPGTKAVRAISSVVSRRAAQCCVRAMQRAALSYAIPACPGGC